MEVEQLFIGAIPIDQSEEIFIRLESNKDVKWENLLRPMQWENLLRPMKWSFRRSHLNYYFPQSLITTTLELDPTINEITFSNPDNLNILWVCTALYRKHYDIAKYLIDYHIEMIEEDEDDEDNGYF